MKPFLINSISSVSLPVTDIERTARFYRDHLGFTPRRREGLAGEQILLTLGEVGLSPTLAEHITPLNLTCKVPQWSFLAVKERLEMEGVDFIGPEDRGSYQVLKLLDPDGHSIEIVAFCTKEELSSNSRPRPVRPRGRHAPDRWHHLYGKVPVDRMPWYTERLDDETEYLLFTFAPLPGRMLELGCGAGNQAARLAAVGYEVTGIDIASGAIEYAEANFAAFNPRLHFEVADVTASLTHLGVFDYGFDQGCFHTLPPDARNDYVKVVGEVLKKGGILFLKVFSKDEPGDWGPFRFSGEEIEEIFSPNFRLLNQEAVSFQGTLSQCPKGILSVLERS